MKKIILTGLVICICSTIKVSAFDWSSLANVILSTNSNPTNEQTQTLANASKALSDIQTQVQAVDNSVQNNFLSIVSILSSKKETKSIKEQLALISKDTSVSENEKTKLLNQIFLTYANSFANSDSALNIQKLSASKKIELIKQIALLEQNGQQYTNLAKQAITVSASNFMQSPSISAEDIVNLAKQTNQTANLIKEKAVSIINFTNQLRSIAKTAGITQ